MLLYLCISILFLCMLFLPYMARMESKQRNERRGRFKQLLDDHESDLSLRRALEDEE